MELQGHDEARLEWWVGENSLRKAQKDRCEGIVSQELGMNGFQRSRVEIVNSKLALVFHSKV